MKEIVIISGKGGTGKTSITAAFASLAHNAVFADCDVDAADLHLVFSPSVERTEEFISGYCAAIDPDRCSGCGECARLCVFDAAVPAGGGSTYYIQPEACEGCGVCSEFCPDAAVSMNQRRCGEWHVSSTRFGTLVHACLDIGAENSGKLVTTVRKAAKKIAGEQSADLLIIDGSPGVGCPVIASITGASAVVAVTEPTLSGEHDLQRVIELCRHFRVPLHVCVNKADINDKISERIEQRCTEEKISFLGRIPYDRNITSAQISGKSIIEYGCSPASRKIRIIWEELCQKMQ